MSDFQPPGGGIAPGLVCSRWLAGPLDNPTEFCGKPATWHVIWTTDLENGLCCDEHFTEAKRRWVYYAAHSYEVVCSMPGVTYDVEGNRCVLPGEDMADTVAVALEMSV